MSQDDYNPNSVDAALARIEARQRSNGEKLDAVIEANTERFEKIEGRVSEVEKKQWFFSGATGVVAFLASKLWK